MSDPATFVARGWRYLRYRDHDRAFLLDADAGYFSAVPDRILDETDHAGLAANVTLKDAAATWASSTSPTRPAGEQARHELPLVMLGGRILARFTHAACRDEVARYFSHNLDTSGTCPDLIVDCDLSRADRYLFRARPDEQEGFALPGVQVYLPGSDGPQPWCSTQPVFPPLAVAPFKDRFLALHAATLRKPSGTALSVVGARNSGKTTSALHLGRRSGWEFLADETTFVHLRTAVAEPFAQSLGMWEPTGSKRPVPAAEVFSRIATQPVLIDQVVVLDRCQDLPEQVQELTPPQALCALLPHHRDASSQLGEAMVTLDHLVRVAKVVRLRYRDHTRLPDLLNDVTNH